jgi:hypothetical protein
LFDDAEGVIGDSYQFPVHQVENAGGDVGIVVLERLHLLLESAEDKPSLEKAHNRYEFILI